jgi:hypothetical protein
MRNLGVVRNYSELHAALRRRADELNVSRATLDSVAGLADGHSSKILGPGQVKKLGHVSLGALLGGLGLKIVLVEDEAALRRIQSRLAPRRRR